MDNLERYRKIIKDTLNEYAAIPFSYGEIEQRVDVRERGRELRQLSEGIHRIAGVLHE